MLLTFFTVIAVDLVAVSLLTGLASKKWRGICSA
jgi:hypothetical protein